MNVRLGITAGLALMLFAAAAVAAQGPGDRIGRGMGPGMGGPGFGMHRPPLERALGLGEGRWWNRPNVVDKLKLTDDQRKSMDQILLDHRKDLIDKRGALEKAELDLGPLLEDDQPNENKVLTHIDKVAQARAELEKANARFLLAIRGKLSPDQWKQLKAMRSERVEHMPDHMNRHWRDGGDDSKPPSAPPPPPAAGPGPQGLLNELPPFPMSDTAADTGTR